MRICENWNKKFEESENIFFTDEDFNYLRFSYKNYFPYKLEICTEIIHKLRKFFEKSAGKRTQKHWKEPTLLVLQIKFSLNFENKSKSLPSFSRKNLLS